MTKPKRERFNIAIRQTKFRGFKLFYENESATNSMVRAIDEFPSFFTPSRPEPLIIDCGANIGISVLEWKTRWPMARVICFEPDPDAFRLLQMNIEQNGVPGIQCIHAALADYDGNCTLYGDLGKGADARGNSTQRAWGDRPGSSSVEVNCQQLSAFLNTPIDFLKLDIEGSEESVLRESASRLAQVDALYVEIHETDELIENNSGARIRSLLSSAGFKIESESRFEPHALPQKFHLWQQNVGARQVQLLCWRNS